MQIKQSYTYKYEQRHFSRNIDHPITEGGQCFKNVKGYCKTYRELGRNVLVSLVFGMRSWDDGNCTYGYHYLVKDAETGEFSDPQYSRYTFVELHSWEPEDYEKECSEFESEQGVHPAEEFAYSYVLKYNKQILAAMRFIKTQGWCKLSDKKLKEVCSADPDEVCEPQYGKQEISLFNIG